MDQSSPDLQAAILLWQQGEAGPALSHLMNIIRQDSTRADAWELAGFFLVSRKKWDEAAKLMGIAIQAFPQHPRMRTHYAMALDKTGHLDEAWKQVNHVLQQAPELVEALLTKIEILSDAGYFDLALRESAKLYGKNIDDTAMFCEGAASFLTGNLTHGINLLSKVTRSGWRGNPLPEWDGLSDPDKHVVIYNSQGFGDLLQFARYIERAKPMVGSLTLQIPRTMERLMRDSFPDLSLLIEAAHCELPEQITHRYSLMSLTNNGGADFDPLAQKIPYIKANPALVSEWKGRLANIPRPHIGVVWMSPWQMNSPFRVVNFDELKPLIDVAGKHLVSLQMGPDAKHAADAGLFDASPHIKDFADSAALVSELDLLITLDSAPAHLAGALGKPVWTFVPFSAEWRWLVEREDCIWYPSMRLFRQAQPQGWSEVFAKISADLSKFIAGNLSVLNPKPWNKQLPQRHSNAYPLTDIGSK